MKNLANNLVEKITVKTIVTLAIVFTFCFQTIRGADTSGEFTILAATAVINYYFSRGIKSDER